MSHYLLDFTIKSNNFDFDNLIIGRKIKLEEKKAVNIIFIINQNFQKIQKKYIFDYQF